MRRKSHPQKNTLLKNAQSNAAGIFFKRVFFSPLETKIELKKISFPSENKKYPTAQPDTTKTVKRSIDNGLKGRWTEGQLITRVWQKWRFSAPQTHLWLIKVWFSASTFVVKIATFAKPQNVKVDLRSIDKHRLMPMASI